VSRSGDAGQPEVRNAVLDQLVNERVMRARVEVWHNGDRCELHTVIRDSGLP
jgi:hypothetical protein